MNFYNILLAIGACCFPTEQIQMFDELPVELVILILSHLDPKSLSIMSRMNKRLFHICKNNKGLRTTIRRYLRKERKEHLKKMLNPVKVRVLRNETENTNTVFQSRNIKKDTVITRNFDVTQSRLEFKRSALTISKKRCRGDQKENPGPGLTKRMRI